MAMKGLNGQSMNELVSLTVLALMVIALIGAQAGAATPAAATLAMPAPAAARPDRPAGPDRLRMAVTIDEVTLEVDFESLAILFAIGDAATRQRGEFENAGGRND